ncbi:hypothetical protein CRE_09414 [Caenorhabditis remanei]|uniref:Uncharacterized protein n=1 Tax=Caenorhabditis remanei TaxID=31234 RepID=E3LIQ9_CAERE|nr:hypothetical protein CRE_09414 [Caenorhabditis remanei]
MPDVVLNAIFANVDFRSILTLRKVSHGFRTFIDDVRPMSPVTNFFVSVHPDLVSFDLFFRTEYTSFNGKQCFSIKYRKSGKSGCIVQWQSRKKMEERILKKTDFLEVAMQDFEILVNHQWKSVLEMFRLEFENQENIPTEYVLKEIGRILKARKTLLQVQDFCIGLSNRGNQIERILKLIDAKTIQKIRIIGKGNEMDQLDIQKVLELKQFKNAKELKIWKFDLSTPIEELVDFSKVEVFIETVSVKSLLSLKEKFLHSKSLEMFSIKYNRIDSMSMLEEKLGKRSIEQCENVWHFPYPNSSDFVLSIKIISSSQITLERLLGTVG